MDLVKREAREELVRTNFLNSRAALGSNSILNLFNAIFNRFPTNGFVFFVISSRQSYLAVKLWRGVKPRLSEKKLVFGRRNNNHRLVDADRFRNSTIMHSFHLCF